MITTLWFEFRNINNFSNRYYFEIYFSINHSKNFHNTTEIYGSVRLEKKNFLLKKYLLTYLCTVRIIPDVFTLDNTFLTWKVKKEKNQTPY